MFIDTHAHIYEDEFSEDLSLVIERAREAGASRILLPPTDVASTVKALAVCDRFPDVCFPMIGIHPEDVKENCVTELARLEEMLRRDVSSGARRFVAVGEVGLDYYWDKTHKEEQKEAFSVQIEWAVKYELPLMIHSRSANGDLLACLSPWRKRLLRGGVFHCFSGSVEMAREMLRFHPDFYIVPSHIVVERRKEFNGGPIDIFKKDIIEYQNKWEILGTFVENGELSTEKK